MQTFTYPTELDGASIRRLRITPPRDPMTGDGLTLSINTYPLTSLPVYHALSYTWGPPNDGDLDYANADKVPICLNESTFAVFPNLHDALVTLQDMEYAE
jgi:hypothetical protein